MLSNEKLAEIRKRHERHHTERKWSGEHEDAHSHRGELLVEVDRLRIDRDAARADVDRLRAALEYVKAALGDRLLARGPLSEPYAHGVMRDINDALSAKREGGHDRG